MSRKKEFEQLAAFMATMQLLVGYSHVKGYPGTLYTCAVVVKMDNYQIQRK